MFCGANFYATFQKRINFYQHSLKIKLFLKKKKNLQVQGDTPQTLVPTVAGSGFDPITPH